MPKGLMNPCGVSHPPPNCPFQSFSGEEIDGVAKIQECAHDGCVNPQINYFMMHYKSFTPSPLENPDFLYSLATF